MSEPSAANREFDGTAIGKDMTYVRVFLLS